MPYWHTHRFISENLKTTTTQNKFLEMKQKSVWSYPLSDHTDQRVDNSEIHVIHSGSTATNNLTINFHALNSPTTCNSVFEKTCIYPIHTKISLIPSRMKIYMEFNMAKNQNDKIYIPIKYFFLQDFAKHALSSFYHYTDLWVDSYIRHQ